MVKVLIIGGSDAGISAALRIRELAEDAEATILLRDEYPNFSICGLPMYLSGEVKHWRDLAHRTKEDIEKEGIRLFTSHEAVSIDAVKKELKARDLINGKDVAFKYDKLIIGTGAESRIPTDLKGLNCKGVFQLRWMGDVLSVQEYLKQNLKKAIVVGGGYVGLELADGLTKRGLEVTLIESRDTVLQTCHASFGQRIKQDLEEHGVTVITNERVEEIIEKGQHLNVSCVNGFKATADIVVISIGAVPNTSLGETAGLKVGEFDAFVVNNKMETNVADIYAAGDCIETLHCVLQKPMYLALGTTSHKQGRIAGENAIGGTREFAGTVGTQVIKIFDTVVGRTGLREDEAKANGFETFTVEFETYDHKVYFPGATRIVIRITADSKTQRILGAQIYGKANGQIAKRIDTFAQAIYHKMDIEQFNDLDLSYSPPLSSPWDPTQMATQAWAKEFRKYSGAKN